MKISEEPIVSIIDIFARCMTEIDKRKEDRAESTRPRLGQLGQSHCEARGGSTCL